MLTTISIKPVTYSARNGCSSSSEAVARLSGSGSKHLAMQQRIGMNVTHVEINAINYTNSKNVFYVILCLFIF
jgi:hypothetical protein